MRPLFITKVDQRGGPVTSHTAGGSQKAKYLNYLREKWLGWQDSNLRMTRSKPVALPLGDTPLESPFLSKEVSNLKP